MSSAPTVEAKLQKLSKSIEHKFEEINSLHEQEKTLQQEILSLQSSMPHPLLLPELNKRLAELEYDLVKATMTRDTLVSNNQALEADNHLLGQENSEKTETITRMMTESKSKFFTLHGHSHILLEAINSFEERSLMAAEDLETNLELCRLAMQNKGQTSERLEWLKRLLKTCEAERMEASRVLDSVESEFQLLQRNGARSGR